MYVCMSNYFYVSVCVEVIKFVDLNIFIFVFFICTFVYFQEYSNLLNHINCVAIWPIT